MHRRTFHFSSGYRIFASRSERAGKSFSLVSLLLCGEDLCHLSFVWFLPQEEYGALLYGSAFVSYRFRVNSTDLTESIDAECHRKRM
ncbi:hypothetical protein CEXT_37001 [Caerostris extrusa]|uniref:Uncharacterized protein n=1 Tax=Caerostris extrusa TaxID=172846 RepID=A0AAV4ULW1_CAEEX|nr:hypothetical protein CEXT_37001 [Caerostris extrusa]